MKLHADLIGSQNRVSYNLGFLTQGIGFRCQIYRPEEKLSYNPISRTYLEEYGHIALVVESLGLVYIGVEKSAIAIFISGRK